MNWADAVAGESTQVVYFIDQVIGVKNAADLPVRIPELANNHLDYMLTWYSFVIILLVIYLILHKRMGRLYIDRK
jgi:cytochrome oxidase assembly protein ShyY1